MFGFSKPQLQQLASEEDLEQLTPMHVVEITKKKGHEVGLTLGNCPHTDGVIVVRVKNGSLSHDAGIRRGMCIVMVNEHSVGTHAEAVALIDRSAHDKVTIGLLQARAPSQKPSIQHAGSAAILVGS